MAIYFSECQFVENFAVEEGASIFIDSIRVKIMISISESFFRNCYSFLNPIIALINENYANYNLSLVDIAIDYD